jgi:hypothetical protein
MTPKNGPNAFETPLPHCGGKGGHWRGSARRALLSFRSYDHTAYKAGCMSFRLIRKCA